MAEIPIGSGVVLVSQLAVEETLDVNPVAQQLLDNLIDYGLRYKITTRPVAFVGENDAQLSNAVKGIGVTASAGSNALQALSKPGSIALLSATPACLKQLADNPALVNAFTKSGGLDRPVWTHSGWACRL